MVVVVAVAMLVGDGRVVVGVKGVYENAKRSWIVLFGFKCGWGVEKDERQCFFFLCLISDRGLLTAVTAGKVSGRRDGRDMSCRCAVAVAIHVYIKVWLQIEVIANQAPMAGRKLYCPVQTVSTGTVSLEQAPRSSRGRESEIREENDRDLRFSLT